MTARRFLIAHNPMAGRRRHEFLAEIVRALGDLGCLVTVRTTSGPGDAIEMARAAEDVEVVVAAGGDGTLGEVAHGLCLREGERPALAMVPLGTINVFAAEIGMPKQSADIARMFAEGPLMETALGTVEGRDFITTAGAGVDAASVGYLSVRLKKLVGETAYHIALVRALIFDGGAVFDVEVDGTSYRVSSLIVTNASRYASERVLVSDARLTDDTLHVVLGMKHGRWNLVRYGVAFLRGKLATLPDIHIMPMRQLTIRSPSGKPVQLDGDNIASVPVKIALSPERLQMVVPG